MTRIWRRVRCRGVSDTAQALHYTFAEIRAVGRWAKANLTTLAADAEAEAAFVLDTWHMLSDEQQQALRGQSLTLTDYATRAVELEKTAQKAFMVEGYIAGRYPGEFTKKELFAKGKVWSAFEATFSVLQQAPDSVLEALGTRGEMCLRFKAIARDTLRGRAARKANWREKRKQDKKKGKKTACVTDATLRAMYPPRCNSIPNWRGLWAAWQRPFRTTVPKRTKWKARDEG